MNSCARFLLLLCCSALAVSAQQPATATITAEALKADVSFLASDELEGRATPSPGLDRAAEFLAARHEKLGLKPAFSTGYRNGPLLADRSRATLSITHAGGTTRLEAAALIHAPGTPLTLQKLPVWNTATVAQAAAPADHALLQEDALTPAALSRAERAGAKAILLKEAPAELPRTRLPLIVLGALDIANAQDATLDLDVPAGQQLFAANVASVLVGTELPERYIMLSAHYDHIGRRRGASGDQICNGADDDASGTAGVLAIAGALARTPQRRSLLFVHFYGEESGFLGSRRFVAEPPVPLAHIDAMFNLEMIGRPDDIGPACAWVTGFDLSDFGSRVAALAQPSGLRVFEHPRYSRMLFTASDNLPFATAGVVAHSISAGSLHKDYHQPSDEAGTLNYANMALVCNGLTAAVQGLAAADEAPAWKPGTRYATAGEKR